MKKAVAIIFFLFINGSVLGAEYYASKKSHWNFHSSEVVRSRIFLVPVAGFKSKIDQIHAINIDDFFLQNFILSQGAYSMLEKAGIRNLPEYEQNVPDYLDNHPDEFGLVRISELSPRMRVIPLNSMYFYQNQPDYILTLHSDDPGEGDEFSKIFTFAQTGVTALTRGLIKRVNQEGDPLYASERIAPFLRKFDITHTSNEVSFAVPCDYLPSTRLFCTPLPFFEILKDCGFDIIELTGNHMNDFGYAAAEFSITRYNLGDMRYFGGGKNLEDAQKPLFIDRNRVINRTSDPGRQESQIALLGYNHSDVYYEEKSALADLNKPGANPYDPEKMKNNIISAREIAQTVIVDIQFAECYPDKQTRDDACYEPLQNPDQRAVFRQAIDFGADIVVGTQAHQPQIIELYKNGIIFYGLGNLFFDQTQWEGTRQGMILAHIFFEGKYKTTIVFPTYYDEKLQVHLAEGEKKSRLLDIYYQRP